MLESNIGKRLAMFIGGPIDGQCIIDPGIRIYRVISITNLIDRTRVFVYRRANIRYPTYKLESYECSISIQNTQ